MATQTPIAFLLVKFQGSNAEPMTNAAAVQMFTAAGRGTMNVVDWFDDNTHGHIDMTGNAVFGWLQLTKAVGDYTGSGVNPQGRQDIITWARPRQTLESIYGQTLGSEHHRSGGGGHGHGHTHLAPAGPRLCSRQRRESLVPLVEWHGMDVEQSR